METVYEKHGDATRQSSPGSRSFALFLLFCAIHFAIVSGLFLVVLNEVSGGVARTSHLYVAGTHPQLWDAVFESWRVMYLPAGVLDEATRLAGMDIYRWNETPRVLLQCAFCGLVWGLLTFCLYTIVRATVAGVRRLTRKSTPQQLGHSVTA